ncbi:helix-turn-helix transcriptional regulator [Paracoccus yeei]|uniref:helix-turn-helix transcriptional regulator n=1 Tax=Paracoccus yeei TaxID=147645 RepID=UPI001C8DC5B1|nr:AlpA family phage regulatory protein [Paracoccus yeei]MBY0136349.1 AlpA family phage regulatory protein [Paracoccus yeei]
MTPETYLSDLQLAARYGVHRTTPWGWAKTDPCFPKPLKLSPGCTRWKLSEIEAWEASRANAAA